MISTEGKTEYRFTVQNAQDAEQKIQSWLSANSFQPIQEEDTVYYRGGDAMVGYRFLEYEINGPQVIICAYVGSFKKPHALTNDLVGSISIAPYQNALEPLLASLSSGVVSEPQQSSVAAQPQQPPMATQAQPQDQQQNTYKDFKQATSKRNGIYAEISFWISIAMFIVAFTGVMAGAIIVVLNYYLAIQGLKSNKKWKAITAIVVSSLAIIVFIVKLIIDLTK